MKCKRCWGTGKRINHRLLGKAAKKVRLARGWSLMGTAKRLGISDAFLCLLESGKRSWTEKLYRQLLCRK